MKGGIGVQLEQKILEQFKKKMKKEVEGLDLIVAFNEDTWPDDDNIYSILVMETKANGKVWDCECSRNGNIKYIYEL
jgi:hypothetical protein